jgi:hypothetical protein
MFLVAIFTLTKEKRVLSDDFRENPFLRNVL